MAGPWTRLIGFLGRRTQAGLPEASSPKGLVLVADGIGGLDLCGLATRRVVRASGLAYTTTIVRWGHGRGRWYADLSDVANWRSQAARAADTIRRFRDENPTSPIFLIGKSGGCAVIVAALENLDAPLVERAVLLAPALSPTYDLTKALSRVRSEVVVFWSPWDVFFLGVGTRVFGTSDRLRSSGAGRVGFRRPARSIDSTGADESYERLRQVRWSPVMGLSGYFGGHLGTDSPFFLARYVLPLLRTFSAEATPDARRPESDA